MNWRTQSYVDEGDLCFVQEGEDVAVEVTAPDCLSSSCTRNVSSACDATVDGSTIEISSDIEWEERYGECTTDCGSAKASCLLPGLPHGDYVVMHGDEQTMISVPITQECTGGNRP